MSRFEPSTARGAANVTQLNEYLVRKPSIHPCDLSLVKPGRPMARHTFLAHAAAVAPGESLCCLFQRQQAPGAQAQARPSLSPSPMMTQPIDIPVNKRSPLQALQTTALDRSLFSEEDGPYFAYVESFEGGHTYTALSSGAGKFVEIRTRCDLPSISFIVKKDRFSRRITLEINSFRLRRAVCAVLGQPTSPLESLDLNFNTALKNYEAFKAHLIGLQETEPDDEATSEVRLLVEDLLLDRGLYDGMNMDMLREQQILCSTHIQDIHTRSVSLRLHDIEECFSLGQLSNDESEQNLAALNVNYAHLAQSGEYEELRACCEPLVRSGAIEIEYDPVLLLEVLQNGHLDVFQYILGLIVRTGKAIEMPDSQYPDVTYDPLYVAISLGQLEAVRRIISDHETFEGYVVDESLKPIDNDRVFTPLYAATYWQQPDIVRLLLHAEPLYYAGMPQATALAQQRCSWDILQILMERPPPSTPATYVYDIYPQPAPSSTSFQFSVSPQVLQYNTTTPANGSRPSSVKSVSGITNGLSGLDTNVYPLGSIKSEGFSENPSVSSPLTVVHDMGPPSPSSAFSTSALQYGTAMTAQSPSASDRSISGIAHALSGLDTSMFESEELGDLVNLSSTDVLHPPQDFTTTFDFSPPTPSITIEPTFEDAYSWLGPSSGLPSVYTTSQLSSIRHTKAHKGRQQLGRNLMQRLQHRCERLRRWCSRHYTTKAIAEVSLRLGIASRVWRSGIDCFRDITENKAPSSLVDVLLVLFVADALGCQGVGARPNLQAEFINDLGRWKTLLDISDYDLFDEIACAVWDINMIPIWDSSMDNPVELYRFQELVQNLICLQGIRPLKSGSFGSRLQAVQKQLKKPNRKRKFSRVQRQNQQQPPQQQPPPPPPIGSFQSIDSILGGLTYDTDESGYDEADISELIDFGAFEEDVDEPMPLQGSNKSQEMPAAWKDVHPRVVLALASVAFSTGLAAMSAIQDGPENDTSRAFSRAAPGYSRSCAILEGFLSFQSDGSFYDSGIDVRSASEKSLSPWVVKMKKASQQNSRQQNSRHQSLNPSTSILAVSITSISSPSGSSFISTDVSSPETARVKERRVKCDSCFKTFSSISNRNKHMREGCSKIERSGYKCHNCNKVLTTKWYRDRHEQTRCRFRLPISTTEARGRQPTKTKTHR
ncbi:hypothetical protein BGZ63DRAFT_426855 [Mariannaea sp. PMI_226]|nr:hypothetical protein BGZ63DRAFT_426855 [Mariannaea sp. PMI_226]